MNFVPNYDIEIISGESSNTHDVEAAQYIVDWLVDIDAFKSPDLVAHTLTFSPFLNSLNRFKFCYKNNKYEATLNFHCSGPTASARHLSVSLQPVN